jgi:hypothetical protein
MTFEQITQDPTIKQENRLNSKLLQLKNDEFITTEEYHYANSRIHNQPESIDY